MPMYDYRCTKCDHTQVEVMKIADLDVKQIVCKKCGEPAERFIGSQSHAFMTPESLGRIKPDAGFREFLGAIKKAHPDGYIRDR